ncbi:MAG: HDOD domain-containing protein [Deltaproteobacteria bacterium]|nr:MAG: HDOD domain-containing protein [Deltaproteobacteria bacterium]
MDSWAKGHLLERLDTLPPLPAVARELEHVLADRNSTAVDVARLIEKEPGIASRVLRLANSAYFAVPGGVGDLKRAVSVLGFSAIHQLVLCVLTYHMLERSLQVPRALFAHAQAVSALTVSVAARLHQSLHVAAFTAGLLHDLGRLAIAAVAPEPYRAFEAAVARGAEPTLELEAEYFGHDHQEVGRIVGESWGFPPVIVAVLSDHHGPGTTEDREAQELSDLVAAADDWAWRLGRPGVPSATETEGRLHPVRAKRLGLDPGLSSKEKQMLQRSIQSAALY